MVVSVDAAKENELLAALQGKQFLKLGTVTNSEVKVNGDDWGRMDEWSNLYDTAIENCLSENKE